MIARPGRLLAILGTAQLVFAGAVTWAIPVADRAFPPPLEKTEIFSREVVDKNGKLLRAFTTPGDKWRLKVTADEVDPQYIRMLIAYEDQRFYAHGGIDLRALARAAYQFASNIRILSGGSTLSMQVARLIEPRTDRTILAKLRQMARAAQLERRFTKAEILDLYLNLAPYGGNIEGVRAASLAWFGKEPARLNVAQSALLVALPQLPERRRPDRFPKEARAARERVLTRLSVVDVIGDGEASRADRIGVPRRRLAMPAYAAHLSEVAIRKSQDRVVSTTLRKPVQAALEAVARQAVTTLGPKVSVALIMADARTGEILGENGSADYFDFRRAGFLDMTRAVRSPGSTLKPFIYGLAFEEGLIAQQTLIEDRPADFFGYRPRNFDMSYQGDVTIRQALQLSLNVPAVRLLDSVGPSRLLMRFRRAGVQAQLPKSEAPGLAIALGGVGVTLKDLVQLYAGLANGGRPVLLGDGVRDIPTPTEGEPVLSRAATWQIGDILSAMRPPKGAIDRGIAYKTGTSYGYRDAWSIGYDGHHVIGVWVGRADNAAIPGISGYQTAAPILFEAFGRTGLAIEPLEKAPPGAVRLAQSELPASLKRFSHTRTGLIAFSTAEPAPQIVYPPEGAEVELGLDGDDSLPLALKLQGGRPPFRLLANGEALPEALRKRNIQWQPRGAGFSTLTVIDALGRAASVRVFVK